MEKEVTDIMENTPKFGPNRKHYIHLYFDGKFAASPVDGDGAEIKYGYSRSFLFGIRYKHKIKGIFQIGGALEYWNDAFHLRQNDKKVLPTAALHKKETITFNNLGSELYLRFNLGKRGNRIGKFVDVGGYGSWIPAASHYIKDDNQGDTYMANSKEVYYTDLQYTNNMAYGLRFRTGYNQWVLSLGYRLSDYFDDTFDSEMPRFSAGIQVGLHR